MSYNLYCDCPELYSGLVAFFYRRFARKSTGVSFKCVFVVRVVVRGGEQILQRRKEDGVVFQEEGAEDGNHQTGEYDFGRRKLMKK